MQANHGGEKNHAGPFSLALFMIIVMASGSVVILLVAMEVLPPRVAMLSALSASFAGILATLIENGQSGFKRMLKRLRIWRVHIGYWGFAIFMALFAILIGSQFNPLAGGERIQVMRFLPGVDSVPAFLAFFLLAGVGQELGWAGYLLPRLQYRYSALTASLFRALIVFIWHLPLLFFCWLKPALFSDFPYAAWIAQKGFFLAVVVIFLVFLLPWSILFTWMYNNTGGSLLLVAVLHGSEIWVAYYMLRDGLDPRSLNNYFGYAAVLVAAAGLIVLREGWINLSRKNERIKVLPAKP